MVSNSADPVPTLNRLRRKVGVRVEEALQRSSERGFLGTMTVADQIDHSLGFVWAVESSLGRSPRAVADLGSGGGVPGLVLISCWPDARLALIDANERRVDFLHTEVRDNSKVEVVRGRLEDLGRDPVLRERFDLVTSRSFGVPGVTAECGAPLLEVGGLMIVSEPPDENPDDRWPLSGLRQLGLGRPTSLRFDARFGYRLLVKEAATPDRYPRRIGIPAKRPIF